MRGRPKKMEAPPKVWREPVQKPPRPAALPKQQLTTEQAEIIAGLIAYASHVITHQKCWEWVYRYQGSDLMLIIWVSRTGKPQKHAWFFESQNTQYRTLAEVASVLLVRKKAHERRLKAAAAV
jgi:hypothetical protein